MRPPFESRRWCSPQPRCRHRCLARCSRIGSALHIDRRPPAHRPFPRVAPGRSGRPRSSDSYHIAPAAPDRGGTVDTPHRARPGVGIASRCTKDHPDSDSPAERRWADRRTARPAQRRAARDNNSRPFRCSRRGYPTRKLDRASKRFRDHHPARTGQSANCSGAPPHTARRARAQASRRRRAAAPLHNESHDRPTNRRRDPRCRPTSLEDSGPRARRPSNSACRPRRERSSSQKNSAAHRDCGHHMAFRWAFGPDKSSRQNHIPPRDHTGSQTHHAIGKVYRPDPARHTSCRGTWSHPYRASVPARPRRMQRAP